MSLRRDLQGLPQEMRLAAAAAAALALSLILPWYQKSYFELGKVVQANVSALGVFTFVEAAVLLVAVAVLFLVWARSQRKGFHLPGGDGVAITLAGGWAVLLLVWRLFDKPNIQGAGATMGIQWGMFGALLAAGALIAAGARVRAAHRPEPPNPAADGVDWITVPGGGRERRPDRRPREPSAVTEVLRDRPAWEGEPPDPSRAETTRLPDDPSRAETTRLPDDPSRAETTRLPDPSRAETTRLPDDPSEAPTRRERRPDTAETQRLWDDDDVPPPRPRR
jgi:hypothetical protein